MEEKSTPVARLDSLQPAPLGRLFDSRIFFGHQSVGFNILEGMDDVVEKQGGRRLVSRETRQAPPPSEKGFFHATIGHNGDPLGKIHDFDAILRGGMAQGLDIAFMKLCYVDIEADTNVEPIFRAYRDTLAGLKKDFPNTVFVHFTVPLMSREKGLKPVAKRLLGRPVRGVQDNIAREKLNRLLRAEYQGKEPLFDLALLESTRGDGSRTVFESNGLKYYAMEDAYTSDGGHLNQRGQGFVAEQFIVFLGASLR